MAIRFEDADADVVDFDAFYAHYAPRLRAFVRRKVQSADQADDVVQETFIRAHRYSADLTADRDAWPWLATVATRLVIGAARRASSRHEQTADITLFDRSTTTMGRPTEEFERVEARREIATALRSLPDRQRRVLVLRDVEGLRYEAVADHEGVTVDAVKSLLKRARGAFRTAYLDGERRPAWIGAGIVGSLGRLRRRLAHRARVAAARHGSTLSRVDQLAALPLAAVIVSAGLAFGSLAAVAPAANHAAVRAMDAVDLRPARPDAASAALPRGAASAASSGRAAATPAVGGLIPRDPGATSRISADDNLATATKISVSVFGEPLVVWANFVTQCHTNPVHELGCAAANRLPREVTIGTPQDPPSPAPPPPPPSL